jgi:phospholipid N-methyltransferase
VTNDTPNLNVADSELVGTTLSPRAAQLSDFGLFFSKFVAKGREISSAVPSSPAMVESVLRHVDFSRPANIVELGAGTGPVTERIVDRLRPHHRFVAVENDADFCDILRRRFPEVTLLCDDATRLGPPLAKLGIHRVDYVISGLPTPSLPPRAAVRLARWLRASMSPTGAFIQITVAPPIVFRRFVRFYRRLFETVSYEMVWMNIPPGGVYRCAGPRPTLHPRRR